MSGRIATKEVHLSSFFFTSYQLLVCEEGLGVTCNCPSCAIQDCSFTPSVRALHLLEPVRLRPDAGQIEIWLALVGKRIRHFEFARSLQLRDSSKMQQANAKKIGAQVKIKQIGRAHV